jgi:hypothetical protein
MQLASAKMTWPTIQSTIDSFFLKKAKAEVKSGGTEMEVNAAPKTNTG